MIESNGVSGVEINQINDSTVEDFLGKLKETVGDQTDHKLIYRGHANKDWILGPELLRNPKNPLEKLNGLEATLIEKQIMDDFSNRLFAFRPDLAISGNDESDWIVKWRVAALARHYGLPSRFLDFTTSPLVALFFAIQESKNEDGVVWVVSIKDSLNIWEVGKGAGLKDIRISPLNLSLLMLSNDRRINKSKYERIKQLCDGIVAQYGELKPRQSKLAEVEFVPEHVDARIASQCSVFMYELSFFRKRLWQRLKENKQIWGIGIPAKAKNNLRQKLSLMGINDASLFPGLEGAAKQIRWQVYNNFE